MRRFNTETLRHGEKDVKNLRIWDETKQINNAVILFNSLKV
jgi:hypothetical protein